MPTTPNQQNSSVRISKSDMESGDPSRLNRILNLLAQKIPSDSQITQIVQQYITNNSTSGGGGGGGGGGGSTTGISGIEVMVPVSGFITPTIGVNFTHEITLLTNVTLDAPAIPTAGAIFCIKLNQDATGGQTVTFNAFYTGMSGFSLDTTALTYASLTFQINAAGTSAALIQIPINGSPIA
jgi:hypothetical protein